MLCRRISPPNSDTPALPGEALAGELRWTVWRTDVLPPTPAVAGKKNDWVVRTVVAPVSDMGVALAAMGKCPGAKEDDAWRCAATPVMPLALCDATT